MKIRYLTTAALIALATPATAAVPVSGDVVLYWNQILNTGLTGSPTVQSRGFAMVDVAIHDAVNAALGGPNKSYLGAIANPGGDVRAAASVAARNVLVALNPGKTAEFDAALASNLALIPDGAAKTNGIATGTLMAAATIALRSGDGSTNVVNYTPSGLIGRWAPTPPANTAASLPQWGGVTPWLITSGNQFRSGPPPALGNAEYTAAFNEVKDIGAFGSTTRSAEQTASAVFWNGAAGDGPWVQAAIDASVASGKSTLQNASIFALLTTSAADAAIATWDSKYYFDYWRPITAIRAGDVDGNPLTIGDPNWLSLINAPPHPSYISAHSAVAGASADILATSFGNAFNFCGTFSGNTRCWTSFSDAKDDAANSRLWGGIHWRFDNEAGLAVGQGIANYALHTGAFAAVPELNSWAMVTCGLGLIGAFLRRRKTAFKIVILVPKVGT